MKYQKVKFYKSNFVLTKLYDVQDMFRIVETFFVHLEFELKHEKVHKKATNSFLFSSFSSRASHVNDLRLYSWFKASRDVLYLHVFNERNKS